MASSQRKQRGIKNDLSVSQTVALFLAILLSVPGVLGEDCRLLSEPCCLSLLTRGGHLSARLLVQRLFALIFW